MAFKEGDIVIYVGNIGDNLENSDGTTCIEIGKKYKVTSTKSDYFVKIKKIESEYYFNNYDEWMSLFIPSNEIIHEDDWVRRVKYGV